MSTLKTLTVINEGNPYLGLEISLQQMILTNILPCLDFLFSYLS